MKRVDLALEQVIFEGSPVGLGYQLRQMKGVTDVSVDPTSHTAHITYDDAALTLEDLKRLVAECGHGFGACSAPEDVTTRA